MSLAHSQEDGPGGFREKKLQKIETQSAIF